MFIYLLMAFQRSPSLAPPPNSTLKAEIFSQEKMQKKSLPLWLSTGVHCTGLNIFPKGRQWQRNFKHWNSTWRKKPPFGLVSCQCSNITAVWVVLLCPLPLLNWWMNFFKLLNGNSTVWLQYNVGASSPHTFIWSGSHQRSKSACPILFHHDWNVIWVKHRITWKASCHLPDLQLVLSSHCQWDFMLYFACTDTFMPLFFVLFFAFPSRLYLVCSLALAS